MTATASGHAMPTIETFKEGYVFFHSATEARFFKEGRIVRDGSGFRFAPDDPEYPGMRVGANDGLEKARAYRQIPAPVPSDDELTVKLLSDRYRVEWPAQGAACDFELTFPVGKFAPETYLKDYFRGWYDREFTKYEPIS